MSEPLTLQDFAAHRNEVFRLEMPVALDLVLAEVQESSNEQIEQFSLIFSGPLRPALHQGTYVLEHPERGPTAIFLVPIGPRGEQMHYEAVFARLIAAARPASRS